MIAAPVSAEICDVACAEHVHADAQAPLASSHSSHHHHDSAVTHGSAHQQHEVAGTQTVASPVEFSAFTRSCAHDSATIVSTLNARGPNTHANVGVRPFIAIGDASFRSPVGYLSESHSPPGPVRSISPLRV
jgi:hypothetical protein